MQVAFSSVAGLLATIVWALTGAGYYWPVWVWLGVCTAIAFHVALRWSLSVRGGGRRAVALFGSLSVVLDILLLCLWGLTGGGLFWPVFTWVATGTITLVLAMIVWRDRLFGTGREEALTERVDELTRTRRGALDVQAAELRRIERDLHDGAQARLVAMSMQLGRAEERLEDNPEAAELVRRARGEATAAIRELRDLARGIAPPVLADRGLAAAVEALARRSAIPVTVEADTPDRPPPVVENAAYFVAAEAITNVAKHAPGASARVVLAQHGSRLDLTVSDDGPGGANPAGSGLTGLRRRVEALDGTLSVADRPEGGTLVHVELPCGS
jgi:signal transduction histidine kinase